MYCALAFKNYFFFKYKNTDINITHEKKNMNSITEIVENKIKPKSQFINEKISNFWTKKKENENGVN